MTAKARIWGRSAALGALAALCTSAALAQAVEVYPAPILHGPQVTRLDASALLSGSRDATPFGVDLAGLMLVDAASLGNDARAKTGPGIDVSQGGATAQLPGLSPVLQPFVGRPLSYQVIGEIEAAITRFYRENGRSLVLVTVPPQEITTGILQVNINAFRLEATEVAGNPRSGEYVQRQIRQAPGQEVDTGRLMEDVAWLNLNPFRNVSVAFEPGQAANATRLTLQVQEGRPWSAYLGTSNGGSADTGAVRVFGGFNMSALPWQDHQLSWQSNFAPESLQAGLWDTTGTKGYVSHAASYFVPLSLDGFRVKATAALSHVSSYAVPNDTFATGTTTDTASLELSFPLQRRTGTWSLVPEAYVSLGRTRFDKEEFFGGVVFSREETRLTIVQAGLRSSLNGRLFGRPTHGDVDVSVVSGRQATEGEAGRDFTLVKYRIAQEIGLEGDRQLALRLSGQAGPSGLHPMQELGLGGESTVRGYPANSASGASGTSLSVEYRLRPIPMALAGRSGQLRPHVFADWGRADQDVTLGSVGLGGQFNLGESLQAQLDLTRALRDAGTVDSGDASVSLRLIARF